MIIEVMGKQHYPFDGLFYNQTYKEIHENDIEKEKLAKANGVENYIKINCRDTYFKFMEKSIIEEMKSFYNLENLNWENIKTNSLKSKVIEVCEYYNSHKNVSIVDLGKLFDVKRNTISKYLKLGTEAGLCNYLPKYLLANKVIYQEIGKKEDLQKDIVLVSKYFNENSKTSISELSFEFNMNEEKIIFCLLHGNKFKLCVFPEYNHLDKKILQFTEYGEFITSFDSAALAAKVLGVNKGTINKACNGTILMCQNYVFRNNNPYVINKSTEILQ
jgi:hypothetical protein